MRQSYIIEIDGIFVAAAACYAGHPGFTLVGMTAKTWPLDGLQVHTLPQAYSLARSAWRQPLGLAPALAREALRPLARPC